MSVHELKALGQRDIWVWTLNICSQVACIWGQTEVPLAYMNANWFHVMRRLLFQRCFQIRCSDTDANEVLCGYQSHTHTHRILMASIPRMLSHSGSTKGTIDATAPVTVIWILQAFVKSSWSKKIFFHLSINHHPFMHLSIILQVPTTLIMLVVHYESYSNHN